LIGGAKRAQSNDLKSNIQVSVMLVVCGKSGGAKKINKVVRERYRRYDAATSSANFLRA
jgi:hypothetical protein